ncbi:MAG: hypothetical protein KKD83_02745 [Chloroflexi bacterium]|nr:hypothetical protein [Chloroflexota bacterium]
MPIRWSALKVSEAAGMIEEYLNQAVEPLEQAMIVAREARTLNNLPQYVDQDFTQVIGKIEDCLGCTQFRPVGWFKAVVEHIRKDLPSGAVEADQISQKYGSTPVLV